MYNPHRDEDDFIAVAAEVVRETSKAVLLQHWFGCGSDPAHNAQTHWVPKSCFKAGRHPAIAAWFVGRNNLWSWCE